MSMPILKYIVNAGIIIYLSYPRERGPMGGAPYIGPRLGGGPIFALMSNDTMTCQKSQSVHKNINLPLIHYIHYGYPWIVQGSAHTMLPSVRVSLDPSDTMEILGLSRDPHTPCHPLSEYLWTL